MTPRATGLTLRATPAQPAVRTQPAIQLRAFTDALSRLGYDVDALLQPTGITTEYLVAPDTPVPCTALDAVLGGALAERRTPNLGARLASVTPIGTWPMIDYLVVTSDTIGEALEQLVRYFHLTSAPVTLSLVDHPSEIRLVVEPAANPFITEYETTIITRHLRAESEQRVRISHVSVMHEPEDLRGIEQLLGCAVRTRQNWAGIAFPRESLSVPLRRRDPVLRRVLEGHAHESAAAQPAGKETLVDQLRALLTARLARGAPDINEVARQLGTSPRTLQRHLAGHGTSFTKTIDYTRRAICERLLVDDSLTLAEVAYLLGFSEPSAFQRAFKRWHSVTPGDYRAVRAGSTPS